MKTLRDCVAQNVRFFRKRLGFTQKHLAALTRLSLSSVREIETGRRFPTAESIDRLAGAFGLRPCKLFYDKEQMELYDKFERIASYYRELSASITATLDEITAKYLKASGVM